MLDGPPDNMPQYSFYLRFGAGLIDDTRLLRQDNAAAERSRSLQIDERFSQRSISDSGLCVGIAFEW
jgi:hypothetical protein